jgi:hypothetical protein
MERPADRVSLAAVRTLLVAGRDFSLAVKALAHVAYLVISWKLP